jgi:glutathione S-transferase
LENCYRLARIPNSAIEGKRYLVGNRLTIADFGPAGTLMYSDAAKIDPARYPNLKAYLGRISGRESCKQTAPARRRIQGPDFFGSVEMPSSV